MYRLAFCLLLTFAATLSALGQERFTNCAAAFIDQRMVVDEYTPDGKCKISAAATGQLTVQTADLSPERSVPTGKIEFRIAIRDGHTKTLLSFSDQVYQQIDVRQVLDKCRPGDTIVLMTVKDRYSLPHHEISVE